MHKSLVLLVFVLTGAAWAADEIAYPEGFRDWIHIRSATVGPQSPAWPRFGGFHSIYANPAAMEGYKSGKFPDGSVLVFDNHETVPFQGAELQGKRRMVDVMTKTGGGWRFSEFDADSKTKRNVTVEQGEKECAACHSQAPTDHVYSQFTP